MPRDANWTTLWLVRHGETEWNREGRQQGHLDSPLTEVGMRQAQAIAMAMAGHTFSALYSSDLGRAMCTAACIGETIGLPVNAEPRLRERHLGVFQGLTWTEAEGRCAQVVTAFRTGDPDYVIPTGESARQRFARTTGCLTELARRHGGETFAVVAHGGVLDGMYRLANRIGLSESRGFKLFNASINVFDFDGDCWAVREWGRTDHLGDIEALDDR